MLNIYDIKVRAAKASKGPWSWQQNRHPNCNGTPWGWIEGPAGNMCWSGVQSRVDADFIAHARQDIPNLIAEVERLRDENLYGQQETEEGTEKQMNTLKVALEAIIKERQRQDAKWGEQNHRPEFWSGILGEEYGELCEAINETVFDNGTSEGGYDNMFREAVHVAAVAVGFLECLQRAIQEYEKGAE